MSGYAGQVLRPLPYAGTIERIYGASGAVISPPFGPVRVITATIDYRRINLGANGMITLGGSAALVDVIQGDSYPFIVSGTLLVPGVFTSARTMFKVNATDADAAALINITVTATLSAGGQIQTDGTGGPFSVLFTLTPAQTVLLVPTTPQTPWYGYHEERLITAAGAEFTVCREARVLARPRLIAAN
jgi:hypothetical protein